MSAGGPDSDDARAGGLALAGAAWVSALIGLGQILATGSAVGVIVFGGVALVIGLAGLLGAWRARRVPTAVSAVVVIVVGALSMGAALDRQLAGAEDVPTGSGVTSEGTGGADAGSAGGNDGVPPTSRIPAIVLREGTLVLAQDRCVDLDTREPDWGVEDASYNYCNSRLGDINHAGDRISASSSAGKAISLVAPTAPTSVDTCRALTTMGDAVQSEDVAPGSRICVRTSSDNLSMLRVTAVAGNNPGYLGDVSFDVVTWRG